MTQSHNKSIQDFVTSVQFDSQGLVPAIIQDFENQQVLMMAYMNEEALSQTLQGPHVVFYSRSKKRLWKKGETSGHLQKVESVAFDCDRDCLLIHVQQNVAACHKGFRSCFYRQWTIDGENQIAEPVFSDQVKS